MITLFLALSVAITFALTLQQNAEQGQNFERIITEIRSVRLGVPLDYRYNESRGSTSNSTPEGLASSPGCPRSDLGYPWLYYKSEEDHELNYKCYLAGQMGPCDYGQKLFVERDNPVGVCSCECFEDVIVNGSDVNQVRFCWTSSPPNGKEVVFLPESKKCQVLYEQGPCKENEWLVKIPSLKTLKDNSSSSTEAFLAKCEDRSCPKGELPTITDTGEINATAKCYVPIEIGHESISFVPANDCPANTTYSKLLKQCVKNASFNHF